MTKNELTKLNDEQLIWACAQPLIWQVRGKDPLTKAQYMKTLSDAQRALFLFQVMFGHAHHGMKLFFEQIAYIAESMDFWAALKSSMKYFNDEQMLSLVGKMERAYIALKQGENCSAVLNELDGQYDQRIPSTVKLIGSYIRNNSADFIEFDG